MSNHLYDAEAYNAVLQSEVNKLCGIGIALLIVLIAITVYSIVLIKEDRTKKFPYVQLIAVAVISVFLMTSFGSSVISYFKDISEEAYIRYEGPASVSKQRKVVFGNIPTWYDEYVIAFDNNGEQVVLSTRKKCGIEGDVEDLYIVYAQHSGEILRLTEQ